METSCAQFSPDYFESRHHTPVGRGDQFQRQPRGARLLWRQSHLLDGRVSHRRLPPRRHAHHFRRLQIRHILAELRGSCTSAAVTSSPRMNATRPQLIAPPEEGGFGLDAVWADDFHHSIEVTLVEASMYTTVFTGKLRDLVNVPCKMAGFIRRPGLRAAPIQHGLRASTAGAVCLLHFEPRPVRQPGLWRAAQPLHFAGNLSRGQRVALPDSVHTVAFHGAGVGRDHTFPLFYRSSTRVGASRRVEGAGAICRSTGSSRSTLASPHFPSPQAPDTYEQSKLRWEETGSRGARRVSATVSRAASPAAQTCGISSARTARTRTGRGAGQRSARHSRPRRWRGLAATVRPAGPSPRKSSRRAVLRTRPARGTGRPCCRATLRNLAARRR
jgi:maltooligosyltrehalose trehalohydrolase